MKTGFKVYIVTSFYCNGLETQMQHFVWSANSFGNTGVITCTYVRLIQKTLEKIAFTAISTTWSRIEIESVGECDCHHARHYTNGPQVFSKYNYWHQEGYITALSLSTHLIFNETILLLIEHYKVAFCYLNSRFAQTIFNFIISRYGLEWIVVSLQLNETGSNWLGWSAYTF